VVEILEHHFYEVEFCDESGQTYAEFALPKDQLIALHNRGKSLKMMLAEV